MAARPGILALDQGTTSTRAILFDAACRIVAARQRELTQHYPGPGWVEHDPEEIWAHTLELCRAALGDADAAGFEVAALGITNQRETALIWERGSGRPIHNAIVWQDRRTADVCRGLLEAGHESVVRTRTGLLIDPYFSATKVMWLLENVPGARAAAERGELAFGTVDSFLLWRLTGGRVHVTDATNASRTMLFNLEAGDWDREILELLGIPRAMLPAVWDCAAAFGSTEKGLLGRAVAIGGLAGDQQAATIGQACLEPGMVKSTYGTGAFVLLNTGETRVSSRNRLLTTVAYRLGGRTTYALEGSIFVAGAAVQWLRDRLGFIESAAQTEQLAAGIAGTGGVYMVPAFTGLGAPHWDPDARGAIVGLTQSTGVAEITRAALEAVCYQTRDLAIAMEQDSGAALSTLRVDGGMVANDWLLQFLADVLGVPVERPTVVETTALGAACLAGLQAGLFSSFDDVRKAWRRDATFRPRLSGAERERLVAGWNGAVARVRTREA